MSTHAPSRTARYSHETRRPCPTCKRDVDAVRATGHPKLMISRHLAGGGICPASLSDVVEKKPAP